MTGRYLLEPEYDADFNETSTQRQDQFHHLAIEQSSFSSAMI